MGILKTIRRKLIGIERLARVLRFFVFLQRQFPWMRPAGIIDDAGSWVEEQQVMQGWYLSQSRDWYEEVYPPSHTIFSPPSQLESIPEYTNHFRDILSRRIPKARLYCFRGANLYSDQGAVISRDNRLFGEFTHHFSRNSLRAGEYFKPFKTFTLKEVYHSEWIALLAAPSGINYYHWIYDVLPRIKLLEKVRPFIELYALPSSLSASQLDTLDLLGISKSQILKLLPDKKIFCERLFVPSLSGGPGAVPIWALQFLRKSFCPGGSPSGQKRKLYISRADAPNRHLLNEPEVVHQLEAEGFECVSLSVCSFQEQVRLFSEASVVVGCHGAGFANLVFASNCRVIELFSSDYIRPGCYMPLCIQLGHQYQFLIGNSSNQEWGDTVVDIGQLTKLVRQKI
ncbi:hypothetical protein BH10CHL1_BH10CHL1_06800 [soil metagenome]